MSLEEDPPPGKIPTIVWAGLAVVVIFLFVVILRVINPPGVGQAPPTPDIVVPSPPPRT